MYSAKNEYRNGYKKHKSRWNNNTNNAADDDEQK